MRTQSRFQHDELVFTACMLVSPERCDGKHLTYAGTMSAMVCMMRGRTELAKWSEANPRRRVTRWTCRPVQSAARDV